MRRIPDRFELTVYNSRRFRVGRSIMARYMVARGKRFRGF